MQSHAKLLDGQSVLGKFHEAIGCVATIHNKANRRGGEGINAPQSVTNFKVPIKSFSSLSRGRWVKSVEVRFMQGNSFSML